MKLPNDSELGVFRRKAGTICVNRPQWVRSIDASVEALSCMTQGEAARFAAGIGGFAMVDVGAVEFGTVEPGARRLAARTSAVASAR